jgi:mono/diheme cytochrome c family protein
MPAKRPIGILATAAILGTSALLGQNSNTGKLKLTTGKEIFLAACVGCHGPDGKGMPDTTVGFEKPDTFPDFSKCDQTTPELDKDWKAIIRDGGSGRGFSPIMPSFSEALTSQQMDLVIRHLRSLCTDRAWPRGELNFPRAIVTEKAFPEDEVVVTTAMNTHGAPGVENEIAYERRIGAKSQLEVSVPVGFTHESGRWLGGVGDIGIGLKRVLFSSLRHGSILSTQGEIILPTGNRAKGLGSGVTTFEGFAAYGQLLPDDWFFQAQAGLDQPTHTGTAPRAAFWRMALGKSFRQGLGLGRLWSPITELVADRDFETGARTNWDVVPQFQVTLNKRQHVRFAIGTRIPATNTAGRSKQLVFYLLWDWFDGGLLEGWK